MKSLVEYINEQLKETSKYSAEFTVKNNTVKVDDIINALSHAHGELPVGDVSIDVKNGTLNILGNISNAGNLNIIKNGNCN